MNKTEVLILGYGEMGHAMQYLLADKHNISIWEKYPTDDFQSVNLEEAVKQADVVIFCLPVNPHRKIAEHIAPLLKRTCICLSIAKGLDEAGQTAAQIFDDVFKIQQPYCLVYGPMISEEIRAGRFAFAQVACNEDDASKRTIKLFEASNLRLEQTTDMIGISWSVILKNVYALIFGMADELNLGDNMRGYLLVAALHELEKIVFSMGGEVGSPYHLAGLGDLTTTATSENSHHHEMGRLLARENYQDIQGEGIHTLEMVNKFHLIDINRYPLFKLINNIVDSRTNVRENILEFIVHNNC